MNVVFIMVLKLIVLFCHVNIVLLSIDSSTYCKICANHTLCKYTNVGPSNNCIGYDTRALLHEKDITLIVDRINEKRNYIALQQSAYFPGAANMRKIVWSSHLAVIAQRWADQCDSSLRPDRNDQCRDLENVAVGQIIATITGLSPGINIKSFVDMWFMEALDYSGNVSYYNESKDFVADSFLQLIWAETDQVGCGKARFYAKHYKVTLVNRLVCNFAPKGNIHGKPVYTIGYSATQCPENMVPDKQFTGLCTTKHLKTDNLSYQTVPITSLLRIRNQSDSGIKFEIDPVQQNSKLEKNNHSESSYAAMKRSHSLDNNNYWNDHGNISRNYNEHLQRERGHSRVYHGHNHKNEFDSIHPETVHSWRKFDVTTTPKDYYIGKDYRKHYIDYKCTRRHSFKNAPHNSCDRSPSNACESYSDTKCENSPINACRNTPKNVCANINAKQCTRGFKRYCESSSQSCPLEICPCTTLRPQCYTTKQCVLHENCNTEIKNCYAARRVNSRKKNEDLSEKNQMQNIPEFQNYDSMPDLSLRKIGSDWKIQPAGHDFHSTDENVWARKKVKLKYKAYPGRNRRRRDSEDDINFKPFWQVDEFANRKKLGLKSIRYTTLSERKIKKSKRTTRTSTFPKSTEFITILEKEKMSKKAITEKYLSFDELMHLRKFSIQDISARRQENEGIFLRENKQENAETTTASSKSSSEYTANTPFIRMKHCTRKLTCTWTAASLTDSLGNVIGGAGGGGGRGSNTPPGYVEGCTRTSTCTRDFMHRNKMDTLPTEMPLNETDAIEDNDDDDYCERRSLNRRNSDEEFSVIQNLKKQNLNQNILPTKYTFSIPEKVSRIGRISDFDRNKSMSELHLFPDSKKRDKRSKDFMSYGDLYYNILRKIVNIWKDNKKSSVTNCMCNCSNKTKHCLNLAIFILALMFKIIII